MIRQSRELAQANDSNNVVTDADVHLQDLLSKGNQLRIAHLNTQSMVSTFDKFQATMVEYPICVMTMSETWLKNNPHVIKYVTTPGYNCLFSNRDAIRRGSVGVYIKDHIKHKRRSDYRK